MANSTLANLTAASTLGGTELLYGTQSGSDVKITANQLKTLVLASPTFTGTATFPDTSTATSSGFNFLGTFSVASNLITWPAAAITVARIDAGQTFIGNQVFQASGATSANATVNIITSTTTSSNQVVQLQNDTSTATANIRVNNSASAGTTLVNVANAYVLTNGGTAAGGLYLGTSGNSAPLVFYTGGIVTATNTAMTISGSTQLIQFNKYTTAGLLSNDTSGNITTTNAPTVTGIIRTSSAGNAAAPSLVVGNATTGFYSVSTTGLGFSVNGTAQADYNITASGKWTLSGGLNTSFITVSGNTDVAINLSSNTGGISLRNGGTFITSPAGGSLQLGPPDAASPVAQTLQVQNVVAGNGNTGAPIWTLQGPLSNGSGGGDIAIKTTLSSAASGTQNTAATALTFKGGTQNVIASAGLTSSSPSAGVGYSTGAGGTVSQTTSKSTGVTLNTVSGQITMNNASLGGQSEVSFTLTNSSIAATDVVVVSIASGATANSYVVGVAATAVGSCVIQLGNVTLATVLTDAVVLNFVVIKGVTS